MRVVVVGGLLTALTVAYTSTIIKGFATSGAIVLTTILDHLLFEEPMNSVSIGERVFDVCIHMLLYRNI